MRERVGVLELDRGCGLIWRVVIVKDRVDGLIGVEEVNGFGEVESGIKNEIVVCVKVGDGGGVVDGEGEERKIVDKGVE